MSPIVQARFYVDGIANIIAMRQIQTQGENAQRILTT
jgi:hypothetical protein